MGAVYEDGSRDCPGCEADGIIHPNRVTGPVVLCVRCERIAHNDAMTGFAQLVPYMRKRLSFTDWLIENGRHGETA